MTPNEQTAVEALLVEKQFHTMGDYELAKESTGEDFVRLARLVQSFQPEASPTVPVSVFDEIKAELERAVSKFPTWPTDPIHASKVLDEEVGELSKAVLQAVYEPEKNEPSAVKKEALQAAAMAIRFLVSLDKYEYKPSTQHKQESTQ